VWDGRVRRERSAALLRVLAAVSVGGLALAGCAEPAAETAAPAVSTAPQRTSGPLADGFEIEPGSGLVGTVFPVSEGDGWQAVLRVDGDGERVFGGYVRQAESLGQRLQSEWCCRPEEQYCSDPDDEFTDDEPRGPFRVSCAAYTAFDEYEDQPDQPVVGLRGFFGAGGAGWIQLGGGRVLGGTPPWAPVADGPAAAATDVEVAPDLTPERESPVRVVEGSTLISDPIPSECGTGGYIAVLQVIGEPAPVLRGYEAQFLDAGFGSPGLTGEDGELRVVASTAGGGMLSAVGAGVDPSFVLLERCND
jgi:hypothetical protein